MMLNNIYELSANVIIWYLCTIIEYKNMYIVLEIFDMNQTENSFKYIPIVYQNQNFGFIIIYRYIQVLPILF